MTFEGLHHLFSTHVPRHPDEGTDLRGDKRLSLDCSTSDVNVLVEDEPSLSSRFRQPLLIGCVRTKVVGVSLDG